MIIQPEVEEGIAQRTCMVGGARIDIHLIADTVVQFTFYGDSRPLNSKSILATPDRIVVVGLDVARDLGSGLSFVVGDADRSCGKQHKRDGSDGDSSPPSTGPADGETAISF